MAEDRDEGLTGMFFRAFRQNFVPATKIWLILLAVGGFFGVDAYVLSRIWSENILWTLLSAILIAAAIAYLIVLLYAFPLLARFENTTFGILKTSLLVGLRYLVCTLLMAAVYAFMGWLVIFVFTPAFLLGFGCCAMLYPRLRRGPRPGERGGLKCRKQNGRPSAPSTAASGWTTSGLIIKCPSSWR